MTPEEIAAEFAALKKSNADLAAKNAELEGRIPVPVPAVDPDLAYKPSTWKELDERETKKAEEAALKVLENAEKKKEDLRKQQETDLAEQSKKIEETFAKLEKEGVLKETKDVNDEGGRQRAQVLGALVSLGGQQLENAVKLAKSAWDSGQELSYDQATNSVSLVRAGSAPSANRDQFMASSASRVATPQVGGPITPTGRGDLDQAQRNWEKANGKKA